MEPVRFERIAADDQAAVEALSALASKIVKEHYDPIIGPEQNDYMIERYQSVSSLKGQMEEGCRYYMTWGPQGPMGFFAVREEADGVLFLSKFYLKKECRRQGVGRRQLAFIESLAVKAGRDRIRLTVNKGNAGSIEAYRHLGFSVVKPVCTDIGQGFVMDDYLMEKKLERFGN